MQPVASSEAVLNAARKLNVSLRHVRRMDAAGKIPRPVRLGTSVRWLADEIESWLKAGAPERIHWEQNRDN